MGFRSKKIAEDESPNKLQRFIDRAAGSLARELSCTGLHSAHFGHQGETLLHHPEGLGGFDGDRKLLAGVSMAVLRPRAQRHESSQCEPRTRERALHKLKYIPLLGNPIGAYIIYIEAC